MLPFILQTNVISLLTRSFEPQQHAGEITYVYIDIKNLLESFLSATHFAPIVSMNSTIASGLSSLSEIFKHCLVSFK